MRTIEKRLDELSNPEIAALLRVLLASGLQIESEEELEYWINLLEQLTRQRLNVFFKAQDPDAFSMDDLKGISALIKAMICFYVDHKSNMTDPQLWKQRLKDLRKARRIIRKKIRLKKIQQRINRRNARRPKEQTQDLTSLMQNKLREAGVPGNGAYWNEVMSAFNVNTDQVSFIANWVADQSRIAEEIYQNRQIREKSQKQTDKQARKQETEAQFSHPKNQKQAEKIVENTHQNGGRKIPPALLKMKTLNRDNH